MSDTAVPLQALLTGALGQVGGAPSGIDKRPADRPLRLGFAGLEGDVQGDTRRHGGPDKALHHYPLDHYAAWRAEIGPRPVLAGPGAFGENLSTLGLTEAEAAVGDVFRLGSALVEISQGRQPCWKLNHRFETPDMSRRVQQSGRTGWYYRVLEAGAVAPGEGLVLVDRRAPDWTLRRLWRVLYVDVLNRAELAAMAELPPLPEGWRAHARRRLETRAVEDWTARLDG